jgi:hypothetical protein
VCVAPFLSSLSSLIHAKIIDFRPPALHFLSHIVFFVSLIIGTGQREIIFGLCSSADRHVKSSFFSVCSLVFLAGLSWCHSVQLSLPTDDIPKSIIFVHTPFDNFVLVSGLFYKTYIFEVLHVLNHDIVAHSVYGAASLACLVRRLLRQKWRRRCFGRRSCISHLSIVSVCGLRLHLACDGIRHHLLLSLTRCLLNLILWLTRRTAGSTVCRRRRLTQMRRCGLRRKLCLKRRGKLFVKLSRRRREICHHYIQRNHRIRWRVSYLPGRWRREVRRNLYHGWSNSYVRRHTFDTHRQRC